MQALLILAFFLIAAACFFYLVKNLPDIITAFGRQTGTAFRYLSRNTAGAIVFIEKNPNGAIILIVILALLVLMF